MFNKGGEDGAERLIIFYPAEGPLLADLPLGFVDRGEGDEAEEQAYLDLKQYLLSDDIQDWLDVPAAHRLDDALTWFQIEGRKKSHRVWLLDRSGSMVEESTRSEDLQNRIRWEVVKDAMEGGPASFNRSH